MWSLMAFDDAHGVIYRELQCHMLLRTNAEGIVP